jgi:mitotic spindle assembly checkpoint protein MAD1
LERLGAIQPELATKEENIQSLQHEKALLTTELEKAKQVAPTSAGDLKAKARLERQRNLAVKEAAYLKEQLKALDVEEGELNPEHYQAIQTTRISELETLIDQYRKEVETLQMELSSLNSSTQPVAPMATIGTKRPLEETPDERVGELVRKQRTLQTSLTESQTRISVLESELKAKSSQLSSLRSSSPLRVLELKDNPTSRAGSLKQAQLDALQSENDTLRAQLSGKLPTLAAKRGETDASLVPRASLSRLELALTEKDSTIASRDKSQLRLKEIFRSKGLEFKEAVHSLLGWQLNFQPNGKVKASSMFHPSAAKKGEDAEHFIEFDGENGTMKVSGGPQSEFAREIRGLIEFWVDGRGQVPCFLAAMTLEFYDKYGEVGR